MKGQNDVRVARARNHEVRQQVVARERLDPAPGSGLSRKSHLDGVRIPRAQRGAHLLERERIDCRERDQRGVEPTLPRGRAFESDAFRMPVNRGRDDGPHDRSETEDEKTGGGQQTSGAKHRLV